MGLRGPKPKRTEIAWSREIAYAVGLMASDGNLSLDGRHLTLVSKDIEQIQNIKTCFGITANASHKASAGGNNTNLYYRLQWGDVILYNFLSRIGLTPRKSLTLGALQIPDEYFFDFLRGSFDGDGCFYSYFDSRWRSSFMFYITFCSASEAHIKWLRETIYRLAHVQGHVTRNGQGGVLMNLRYAKTETLALLPYLYPSITSVSLSRKRLKIEKALRIVGKSLLNY